MHSGRRAGPGAGAAKLGGAGIWAAGAWNTGPAPRGRQERGLGYSGGPVTTAPDLALMAAVSATTAAVRADGFVQLTWYRFLWLGGLDYEATFDEGLKISRRMALGVRTPLTLR